MEKVGIEMKERRTVTIVTCDRASCKKEVGRVTTIYGPKLSESICSHAQEFDLCDACLMKFMAFMENEL